MKKAPQPPKTDEEIIAILKKVQVGMFGAPFAYLASIDGITAKHMKQGVSEGKWVSIKLDGQLRYATNDAM
jgi:hypothetical protein